MDRNLERAKDSEVSEKLPASFIFLILDLMKVLPDFASIESNVASIKFQLPFLYRLQKLRGS